MSLVELPEPVAGEGQAVLEVAACGICGSDLHSYRSAKFLARPGQVLGHEFCGTVLEAPGVDGLAPGTRVTVRPQMPCGACAPCEAGLQHLCEKGAQGIIGYGPNGGFAERVLVPRAVPGSTVFPLPAVVDDRGGALVEPLAVALRAVKQAGDVMGASALVLGAGMIGLGVTQFLRLRGAGTVVVADPSETRRDAALTLGADVAVDPATDSTVAAMQEITGAGPGGVGARADVVIDCAGVADALADGLAAVRPAGTVVLCAVYAHKIPVRPDWIVSKELTVRGSFAYCDEFPDVIAALSAGHVDPQAFISHELPLDRIGEAFETQADPAASLKVLVRP